MNLKSGVVVAMLLAATASAAFLARHEVRRVLEERGLVARESARPASFLLATSFNRPSPVGPFTVQGEVVGSGATSGTLTLRVGSAVSTLPITVSPGFSVVIAGAQGNDMVSIEIVTPTYRYMSLLGSYTKLVRLAGADATLTSGELDRVRVSSFSTSLYFFIQRELAGRLPVSDSEHEKVIRSVSGDDIATATSALQDLAVGRATLPLGYANGYALLQDKAGYRVFLSQYGYTHINALMSAPAVPIRPVQLGMSTLLLGAIPLNDVQMFYSGGVRILTRTTRGWASHSTQSRRNVLSTPHVLASGELELTPHSELSSEVWVFKQLVPLQPSTQVRERRTVVREVYRQVFAGERYSLWAARTEWVATYPDYPAAPPELGSETGMFTASKLDGLLPFRVGELDGKRVLPVFCKQGLPLQLGVCEAAVQRFSADGTGYSENVGLKVDGNMQPFDPIGGAPFQWTNGRRGPLQLTYSDASVTYWRINQGDAAVDVLVYVARAQDGADTLTVAGGATMINADLPGDFADLSPVGTWRYASFEQFKQPYGYHPDSPPVRARFLRNADGTTVRWEAYDYDLPRGTTESNLRYGWRVLDGMLYETRYRANISTGTPNTFYFSSCESAYAMGATQCAPNQARYFLPLAKVGNRLYGIQEIYGSTTGYLSPYAPVRASYPSFIEKL